MGTSYDYIISTIDPEGNDVYYWIEWFEGCPGIFWQGPYGSGEEVTFSNTWSEQGEFTISVTAKDVFDLTSDTSTLKVSIPRNRATINEFITVLFEHFPILKHLMNLFI